MLQGAAWSYDLLPFGRFFDVIKGQHIDVVRAQFAQHLPHLHLRIGFRARLELHAHYNLTPSRSQVGDRLTEAVRYTAPVKEIDASIERQPDVRLGEIRPATSR